MQNLSMRGVIAVLLAFACCTLLSACQPKNRIDVTGTVKMADGTPVSGVTVTNAGGGWSASDTTNEKGEFSLQLGTFEKADYSKWTLTFTKEGMESVVFGLGSVLKNEEGRQSAKVDIVMTTKPEL
jgi:hypothetical protein